MKLTNRVWPLVELSQDLARRYVSLEQQEHDIQFFKECCVTKFLNELHSSTLPEFPFPSKFFSELFHGDNNSIETAMSIIHSTLCEDAVYLETVGCGYNLAGVEIHIDVKGTEYLLHIPVLENIGEYSIETDYGSIDWNVGSYHICKRTDAHSWSYVWRGYSLRECKLFEDSDSEILPFE